MRLAENLPGTVNRDSVLKLIKGLKPKIKNEDPVIADYYCLLSQVEDDNNLKCKYADSALAFFSTQQRRKEFPNHYYKALLCRGEISVYLKQYTTALKYFYQARQTLNNGNCKDGFLSVRMASIYYNQKNYKAAAKLWAENYNLIKSCVANYPFQKQFYTLQSVLNSAGVSYQRAGIYDSARYYYIKDVELINEAQKRGIDVNSASTVLYDNLGGLNLTQHHIDSARKYLLKSISYTQNEQDGIKIPPYLKLADLYTQTGEYPNAKAAFNQSRLRLERFADQNLDLEVLWNKLYAKFLFKQGLVLQAYRYQETYIRLKDSLDNVSMSLNRLDIKRELNSFGQQRAVTKLENDNQIKRVFLAGSMIIALLALIIIFLVYRNLKRSRKLHQSSLTQNQQLAQALAELEHANQNYIRIMRVMAHDLRNPIWGMTGLAAVLLDEEEVSEENRHLLQLIESTGITTMEMINELLKSGLANENEVLETESVDLRKLVYDSVELLQFKAKEKNQLIIFESADPNIMGRVNHEKIWRVLNNLIVNAIKFSRPNAEIKVGIKHDDSHIIIFVADNGIGISEKDKDSVFEMFTPAKRVGTGGEQPFGLGLSISKSIIEKHNGKIWFESTPGLGTTFYIQLPYSG
ncbi:HAMP domain-containing sensor histidine kinase [Mucilaginibacter terrae]|uniref:HAMP domain-containing sensor histidine kinase n=1 Tax=Mucilaginibacter terrae TaxID=1955052 RepID=UPI002899D991|nr:HAMP domain-containing sensor histidine kinase [Mucilaginibacter terrae]